MKRRDLLKGGLSLPLLSAAALGWATPGAAQQDWPTRAITMIVPFPPGGQADLAARPIAAALEKILGRPVVVPRRRARPDRSALPVGRSACLCARRAEAAGRGRQAAYSRLLGRGAGGEFP